MLLMGGILSAVPLVIGVDLSGKLSRGSLIRGSHGRPHPTSSGMLLRTGRCTELAGRFGSVRTSGL